MSNVNNMTNMSFRVNRDLKRQADELFKALGMNTSVALNMFLTQCVREQSIPFTATTEVPNSRLLEALEEVRQIRKGEISAKAYNNLDELFEDLNSDD